MAIDVLLSGLLGAAIGAIIGAKVAVVVAARQIRAGQALQRRDELREVIADFWGANDLLWEYKQELGWTNYEIQAARQSGTIGQVQGDLEARRQRALTSIESAKRDARRALAILRLLFPELVTAAERLLEASQQKYQIRLESGVLEPDVSAARAKALEGFEHDARVSLDRSHYAGTSA